MIFLVTVFLTAIALSSIAAYFSIIGLLSIFPVAGTSVLIMGILMEIAKVVSTVWLKINWNNSPMLIRLYLLSAIIILMLITAMGGYGFLSKAHLEQGASTVDNSAKIEQAKQDILREQALIADNDKVIAQLDATVNSLIGKARADRALTVRKSQQTQRKQLKADSASIQKTIDELNTNKFKLESEIRQLQLEVGPIRYIAQLIYGAENSDTKTLESAVRMFTLLIVSTLDPLAIILLIAANFSLIKLRNEKEKKKIPEFSPTRDLFTSPTDDSCYDKATQTYKNDNDETGLHNECGDRLYSSPHSPSCTQGLPEIHVAVSSEAIDILDKLNEEENYMDIQRAKARQILQVSEHHTTHSIFPVYPAVTWPKIQEDPLVNTDTVITTSAILKENLENSIDKTDIELHKDIIPAQPIITSTLRELLGTSAHPGTFIPKLAVTTQTSEPIIADEHKYHKAHSWLTEFKRT